MKNKNADLKVVLLCCPANFPFWFAKHTWLLILENKQCFRYEVGYKKNKKNKTLGYIYINKFKPMQGIRIFSFYKKLTWNGKIVKTYKGKNAENIKKVLTQSVKKYPAKENYKLIGPNSNSYIAWVLKQSENDISVMPKNALGKNYNFDSL